MPDFQLTALDFSTVGIYVVFIVGLGLYLARKMGSPDDYFLAGRSLTWWLIGFSLFASNMSTSSLIGMSGEGYFRGVAVYNYEWMAAVVMVLFAVFLLPLYLNARLFTMPEFLERRFSANSRYYFSFLTIIMNIVIDTAGGLFAAAMVVKTIYPDFPMIWSVIILAILAGLYTIAGGLKAVVYTDAVQAVLLIIGACAVSYLAWQKVGSWEAVQEVTTPEMLTIIQPADDPFMPWPGIFTGVFLLGFYFWCMNQFMVQRTLGAKDLNHARWGALFAGALKLPIIFIMVLPGTFARVLYPETAMERPDMVFPTLMFDLLPVGVRGAILTALLAAIMSSVDSTLNSASTLLTMDFLRKLKPNATGRDFVRYGRIFAFVFMVLAAAWTPQILNFPTLWDYLQKMLAYLSPPIVTCFLVGILWARANGAGAFAALIGGHVCALVLFLAETLIDGFSIPFLYLPPILLAVSGVIMVVVSLATAPPDPERIANFVWSKRLWKEDSAQLAAMPWWQNYRYQALALLVVLAVFLYFWI